MEDQVVDNEEFIVTANTDEEDTGHGGYVDPVVTTAILANDGSNLIL